MPRSFVGAITLILLLAVGYLYANSKRFSYIRRALNLLGLGINFVFLTALASFLRNPDALLNPVFITNFSTATQLLTTYSQVFLIDIHTFVMLCMLIKALCFSLRYAVMFVRLLRRRKANIHLTNSKANFILSATPKRVASRQLLFGKFNL